MDKIYEIYTDGNSLYMLTTEQHLADVMNIESRKNWYYKEISITDAICKYGNKALCAERTLQASVPR